MVYQYVSGAFQSPASPGTAVSSVQPSHRAGALQQNRQTGWRVTSIQKQTLYVIQEAPREYIRSFHNARTAGSYRTELNQSQTKEAVGQMNLQKLHSILSDLERTGDVEGGFIQGYLNRLMAVRDEFMSGDKYSSLTSIYDPVRETASKEPQEQIQEAEPGVSGAPEDAYPVLSTDITGRAENVADILPERAATIADRPDNPVPTAKTASTPDPVYTAFASSQIIK